VRGYDPAAYGDRLGADYDTIYPADALETDATVDFLAELAERHPNPAVLEFGIGTGRLAIELHHRGLRVAGIEASKRMVAALRDKGPHRADRHRDRRLRLDPYSGIVLAGRAVV